MDETSRKRPLEDDDPSSTVSPSKRSRAPAPSGRAQRQSLSSSSSSSTDTTSTVSSRDSSTRESSSAEEDSDDESTSSGGTTSSSASSSPSSSSSSSSSSESERGDERRVEDAENDSDESDDSSDDEEDDSIINVRGRPRPRIQRINGDSSVLSRISDFLPRLKAANEELRRNFEAGKSKDIVMDDVDEEDEGQYIEMNLGLGVLEGQNDEGRDESSTKDDSDGTSDNEPEPSTSRQGNSNVLDKLMGRKAKSKRPAIEEMKD
ncbi:conserved hypothetical protein [Paecilomyces variotii No. 5]|uniref:Uncharacterized protein n=1 Tax=Byssochlamys spectabilis (strain No. 5 / NBRC 109023) TaxID=1356009 RepID=V5FZ87_BYSSN|nr:conserved hypothetical protein [Paecilomyces variotii No. 5]